MNDVRDKYEEIDELGSGHFGTVYQVRNKVLDREEALKIVLGVTPSNSEAVLEAMKQYKLKCDNVVEIYDAFVRNNKLYIAMEYLIGGTLEKKASSEYLPVREVIKYLSDSLHGLKHIHNKGYIHRDIKPNNILLNSSCAKLSDFGLTDELDADEKLRTDFGYSVHKPPEVLCDAEYCKQSDIYALGVSAFRIFNGDAFITNTKDMNQEILDGKFPPRDEKEYRWDVPKKLIKIINKSIDVDLNKRYKNAHKFRADLIGIEIPIDWTQTANRDNKKIWLGSCEVYKYKIEATKQITNSKFSVYIYKGKKKPKRVTKHCVTDIHARKLSSTVRKLLSKKL